ncbi:hypothetical protein PG993_013545 [Apiospora rasikravindrae]|uniref:Uncharacterized protein n=1 Tax=Apiospora rasikravindrae TaxID=990691 RepID=A0ABR1RYF3_9PEZI
MFQDLETLASRSVDRVQCDEVVGVGPGQLFEGGQTRAFRPGGALQCGGVDPGRLFEGVQTPVLRPVALLQIDEAFQLSVGPVFDVGQTLGFVAPLLTVGGRDARGAASFAASSALFFSLFPSLSFALSFGAFFTALIAFRFFASVFAASSAAPFVLLAATATIIAAAAVIPSAGSLSGASGVAGVAGSLTTSISTLFAAALLLILVPSQSVGDSSDCSSESTQGGNDGLEGDLLLGAGNGIDGGGVLGLLEDLDEGVEISKYRLQLLEGGPLVRLLAILGIFAKPFLVRLDAELVIRRRSGVGVGEPRGIVLETTFTSERVRVTRGVLEVGGVDVDYPLGVVIHPAVVQAGFSAGRRCCRGDAAAAAKNPRISGRSRSEGRAFGARPSRRDAGIGAGTGVAGVEAGDEMRRDRGVCGGDAVVEALLLAVGKGGLGVSVGGWETREELGEAAAVLFIGVLVLLLLLLLPLPL